MSQDLYISPAGNDDWSGRLPEPNADGTDGPLATLTEVQQRLRATCRLDQKNPLPEREIAAFRGPCTVWLRGGRYELSAPLLFGPDDSRPVTFAAYQDETPVISGGRIIEGWQEEELNGRTVWRVHLPEVERGEWSFNQLWVNDHRAIRPRLPKTGTFRMVDGFHDGKGWSMTGSDRFIADKDDFRVFRNLTDVEVVVLHFWIEERMPVESYDPDTGMVVSSRCSYAPLSWSFGPEHAPYYIDNVAEALDTPGEWYLDRSAGILTYIPLPGETIRQSTVIAPVLHQLVRMKGEHEKNRYVEWLRFDGIAFAHTGATNPDKLNVPGGGPSHDIVPVMQKPRAAAAQAAYHIPGAVYLEGARHIAFENCVIRNVGWYGIELGNGCGHIRLVGNEVTDTGAGGIKIGGGDVNAPRHTWTGGNRITDNHVHHCGNIYHSGTGIMIRHAGENVVAHNHIHHLYYSAISVGWTWGFSPTNSHNNIIEFNDIHDIGQGVLSDMGAIYLLGVSPGTVVRNNLLRRVESAHYGGWAIYPDEGTSHVVIENNIAHDCNCSPFHQHYGRENIVRNNIFAFGGESQIANSRTQNHLSFTFTNNIVVTGGVPIFSGGYGWQVEDEPRAIRSDLNLFFSTGSTPLIATSRKGGTTGHLANDGLSLDEWQARGHDQHSRMADPGFRDLAQRDFTLTENSPAFGLGFRPIDMSRVGIRPPGERG